MMKSDTKHSKMFMISIISGIFAILVISYLGISLLNKGTYSAGGYTQLYCTVDSPCQIGDKYYYCPSGFSMLNDDNANLVADSRIAVDNHLCGNSYYKSYRDGLYDLVTKTCSDSECQYQLAAYTIEKEDCEEHGGTYSIIPGVPHRFGCYLTAATKPLESENTVYSATFNGIRQGGLAFGKCTASIASEGCKVNAVAGGNAADFLYWVTADGESIVSYDQNTEITIKKDSIFEAKWKSSGSSSQSGNTSSITYTATFLNTGTGGSSKKTCTVTSGDSCTIYADAGVKNGKVFWGWVPQETIDAKGYDNITDSDMFSYYSDARMDLYSNCTFVAFWKDAPAESSSLPSKSSSSNVCDSSLQHYDSQVSCLVNARLECNANGQDGECQQTANGCWKIVCKGSSNTCDASNHEYSEKLNCEVNVGYDCASNGQDGECQQTANGCWTYTCVDVPSTSNCSPTSPSFFTCDTGDGSWSCQQYGYNAVTKYTSCDNNGNSVVKYGCTNDSRCAATSSNPSSNSNPNSSSSSSSSSKNMDYSDAVFGDRCYQEDANKFRMVYVTYCQSEDLSNAKCHTSKDGEELYRQLLKNDLSLCSASNSNNESDNPKTGVSSLIITWIVGLTAIGFAFYYFKKINIA